MQRLENEDRLIDTRRPSQYVECSYGKTSRDIKFYIKL